MASMPSAVLVAVYQPYDFLEGDAIRQALTDAGIFCYLEGESHAGRLYNTTRIKMRVLVRATDAQRAREIIDQGRWPRYT
ncbi:MAG: DUF2007 domain-containing protein [Phycisphaerae bacterium]|nr:DUF2007 domain-containing protein [Phycisphaerae bacterium]